jgi:hypothetical protein
LAPPGASAMACMVSAIGPLADVSITFGKLCKRCDSRFVPSGVVCHCAHPLSAQRLCREPDPASVLLEVAVCDDLRSVMYVGIGISPFPTIGSNKMSGCGRSEGSGRLMLVTTVVTGVASQCRREQQDLVDIGVRRSYGLPWFQSSFRVGHRVMRRWS